MTWKQLRRHTKGRPLRILRRFAITQSTGKQRLIDDAADGGQSARSSDQNKLQFCSALRPAEHLKALLSSQHRPRDSPREESILTGGEDWPDAYRMTPVRAEDTEGCVVIRRNG